MKHKRTGFTLVEILTVVSIIAILLGVLIPTLNLVRNFAKETRQKAQITTIELALLAFRSDSAYSDYPPSQGVVPFPPPEPTVINYCGAQKLAEALLGWDLVGFHPKSTWRADGYSDVYPSVTGGQWTYDPDGIRPDGNGNGIRDTFDEREGLYMKLENANAFRLSNLYTGPLATGQLAPDTFVLCDTFSVKTIVTTGSTPGDTITRRAGTPILYYRANTLSNTITPPATIDRRIYNGADNTYLVNLGRITDGEIHPLNDDGSWFFSDFYNYIRDPKVTTIARPYKPDSYILISAGLDGLYGTEDDITNFGN
ncbi:MAG: type II secretion system protein [Planctomycetota bacterium]